MDTFEAIQSRRAVKHFDTQHRFTQQEEDQLISLALQAPSSFNLQHWRVVLVRDAELRNSIRAAALDQAQITDASLLYVICADLNVWQKNPEQYWRNAPQPVQDLLVPWIKPFYEGKEQLQRDEAMRSVGFFAQTLMLAAKAMGYDSYPMIGFDQEQVAKLIHLPSDHVIGMIVVVGKASKPAWDKPGFAARETILVENRF